MGGKDDPGFRPRLALTNRAHYRIVEVCSTWYNRRLAADGRVCWRGRRGSLLATNAPLTRNWAGEPFSYEQRETCARAATCRAQTPNKSRLGNQGGSIP